MSPAPTKTALLVVCAWAERLSYKDEDAERRHDGHEPILTMPNANHGTGTYLLSPLFNNVYFTVPRVEYGGSTGASAVRSGLLEGDAVGDPHPPTAQTARSLARRMSPATRFLPQRMPMALSSACTLGAP